MTSELRKAQDEKISVKNKFLDVIKKSVKPMKELFGGNGDLHTAEKSMAKLFDTLPQSQTHDFEEIKIRHAKASSNESQIYTNITPLDISDLSKRESYKLLSRSIVSSSNSAYGQFMQALKSTSWVKQGIEYINEGKSKNQCPFCRQLLPENFEDEIKSCFDNKYDDDCTTLERFAVDYENYINSSFIEPLKTHIDYIPGKEFGDLARYRTQLDLIEKTFQINKDLISEKIRNPSTTIELQSILEYVETANELISETNRLFDNNNEIIKSRESTIDRCRQESWENLAFLLKEKAETYQDENAKLTSRIAELDDEIKLSKVQLNLLNSEITQISSNMGGTAATVSKINEELKKTGFRGFTLRECKKDSDKYEVVRENGEPAKYLSEGEKNFIAFLYFYFYVQGAWKSEDLTKAKIVVIDDPVSSMDSSVLYIVGTLIRDLIEDCFTDGEKYGIKQIFILTHNPYFYKEVSNKYETAAHHLISKSAFYFVKKTDDNVSSVELSERETFENEYEIENVSPVKTSYDALWSEYRDVTLPTTLVWVIRRIIDYHFVQLCNYDISEIQDKIELTLAKNPTQQRIAAELLRTFTSDNYDISDDMIHVADHDIDKYKEVLKIIFEIMGQEQHFKKMASKG